MNMRFSVMLVLSCLILFGCSKQEVKTADDSKQIAEQAQRIEKSSSDTMAMETVERFLLEFCDAYFSGKVATLTEFLVTDFAYEKTVYPKPNDDVILSPLSGIKQCCEELEKKGKCAISIPFKESSSDDYYVYLSVELIREASGLKIDFYGLEG